MHLPKRYDHPEFVVKAAFLFPKQEIEKSKQGGMKYRPKVVFALLKGRCLQPSER